MATRPKEIVMDAMDRAAMALPVCPGGRFAVRTLARCGGSADRAFGAGAVRVSK
jgi:hypothetical protein